MPLVCLGPLQNHTGPYNFVDNSNMAIISCFIAVAAPMIASHVACSAGRTPDSMPRRKMPATCAAAAVPPSPSPLPPTAMAAAFKSKDSRA